MLLQLFKVEMRSKLSKNWFNHLPKTLILWRNHSIFLLMMISKVWTRKWTIGKKSIPAWKQSFKMSLKLQMKQCNHYKINRQKLKNKLKTRNLRFKMLSHWLFQINKQLKVYLILLFRLNEKTAWTYLIILCIVNKFSNEILLIVWIKS